MNHSSDNPVLSSYQLHAVPYVLKPWIEALWTLRPSPGARWTEHIWPTLGADLVVASGSRYRRSCVGTDEAWIGRAVVDGVGLQARAYRHTGADRLVGVRLRPGALAALVGKAEVGELAGLAVGLDDLGLEDCLDEALAEADSVESQARRLLSWLDHHLSKASPIWHGIDAAVAQLDQRHMVGQVADSLGVSNRTLQRKFQAHLGLTPKQVQRLLRFRRATKILDARFDDHGFAAALDAGYADQAHFCRECREMTGHSPGHWWGVSHSFNRA